MESFAHRSRLGIVFVILSLCQGEPMKKTHILYKANMSSEQLQRYLTFLVDKGFLVEEKGERRYRITSKGDLFIKEFQDLQKILQP